MASMKVSTVFITSAVLLVGLVGCAQVSYASDGLLAPAPAAHSWSESSAQTQYLPSSQAPTLYGASISDLGADSASAGTLDSAAMDVSSGAATGN